MPIRHRLPEGEFRAQSSFHTCSGAEELEGEVTVLVLPVVVQFSIQLGLLAGFLYLLLVDLVLVGLSEEGVLLGDPVEDAAEEGVLERRPLGLNVTDPLLVGGEESQGPATDVIQHSRGPLYGSEGGTVDGDGVEDGGDGDDGMGHDRSFSGRAAQ